VLAGVIVALAATQKPPHLLMLGALALLMILGIVPEREAFAGLANPGVLAVGALFVVAAGLRDTGALHDLTRVILGRPKSLRVAQMRVMAPVAALSGVMNNTPLVAVMLPLLSDWAKRLGRSTSLLLMPLSFASILGGLCTLLGTSTNLVVQGLLIDSFGPDGGLGLFELAWIGVPCALLGLAYLAVATPLVLRERKPAVSFSEDAREYTVEMLVERAGPLDGLTIGEAGLRNLPGLYLIEINRGDEVLAAVSAEVMLRGGDQLVFAGVVESVTDLQAIRGLLPATDQVFKLDASRSNRVLIEAVIAQTCPIAGQTVKQGRFRSRYNAAVIAVARAGKRIDEKIGDIVLRPGDTLLLEARASFLSRHRNSRDFYLVSEVSDAKPVRHDRRYFALGTLVFVIASITTGLLGILTAALAGAGLMIVLGCCSTGSAMRSIDWSVLLVIAAAFGIGAAMDSSGAAPAIAGALLGLAGSSPYAALAVVATTTMIFTNLISNNAAAVLMYPIALDAALRLGVDPLPLVVGVIVGASCSFATPLGYQTNLMVYGPGGYRFGDFVKLGGPLTLLVLALATALIPFVWSF
jgi:di/tricarboxylate transporter